MTPMIALLPLPTGPGGITTFSYDAADRLTGITRPNGVNTTKTYDNDSRLTGLTEGIISTISLTRDGKGQITAANRSLPLSPALTNSTTTLTYDAASQVSSYTYDAMGQLTGAGTNSFAWDLASHLTSYTVGVETVTATYDAGGRRLSRTANGATRNYVWNDALGLPSISIERQGASDFRYFIHTPSGQLLYSIDAATNVRSFYHFDEMGYTIALTDDSGAVIGSYAYSPYGMLIASTGALDNPFTWQGQYGVMDEGNRLYYVRARYYDSRTRRFISRDPVKSISPKNINPYQYASANPMSYVDPEGVFPTTAQAIARDKARIRKIDYKLKQILSSKKQIRRLKDERKSLVSSIKKLKEHLQRERETRVSRLQWLGKDGETIIMRQQMKKKSKKKS